MSTQTTRTTRRHRILERISLAIERDTGVKIDRSKVISAASVAIGVTIFAFSMNNAANEFRRYGLEESTDELESLLVSNVFGDALREERADFRDFFERSRFSLSANQGFDRQDARSSGIGQFVDATEVEGYFDAIDRVVQRGFVPSPSEGNSLPLDYPKGLVLDGMARLGSLRGAGSWEEALGYGYIDDLDQMRLNEAISLINQGLREMFSSLEVVIQPSNKDPHRKVLSCRSKGNMTELRNNSASSCFELSV